MKRRTKTLLILAALAFAAAGALAIYLATLPRTPEQWFTYLTRLPYPPGAVVISDIDDHRVPLVQNFKSEGTTAFHFRTSPSAAQTWLTAPAPWRKSWTRGPIPVWVNKSLPPQDLYFAQTGDNGTGQLLAIDPRSGDVWLFTWDW